MCEIRKISELIKVIKNNYPEAVIKFKILKQLDNEISSVSMRARIYECKKDKKKNYLSQGFAISIMETDSITIPENLYAPIEIMKNLTIDENKELERILTSHELIAIAELRSLEEAIMMLGIDFDSTESAASSTSSYLESSNSSNSLEGDDKVVSSNNNSDITLTNNDDNELHQMSLMDNNSLLKKEEKKGNKKSVEHTKAYNTISDMIQEQN